MSSQQQRVPSHCTTRVGNRKPFVASSSYDITAAAVRSGDKAKKKKKNPKEDHKI